MPEDANPILSLIKSIFTTSDLRNRVLFMLRLLAVCRMGVVIFLKAGGWLDLIAKYPRA